MKVTYILETLSIKGGIERITVDKMNSLQAVPGYDVSLILVYDYHLPAFYQVSENVKVVNLNIQKTDNYLMKFKTFYQVGKKVRRAVKELQSDIIISSGLLGNILFATNRFNCKTIYESHGPRFQMMLKFLLPRVERRCDAIVTLTKGDKDEYKIAKRVEVIPNFTKMQPTEYAPLTQHRCLSIGRLSYEKNFPRLLHIWSKVTKTHPDWHLDIVGEGPLEREFKATIVRLGLTRTVSLLPPTSDVSKYYKRSSMLIVTSLFEGFSMVIIEASVHGLPTISVDCDYGPREIIENQKSGIITPYDDDQAMIKAITHLMDNEQERKDMGENAKKMSTKYQEHKIMKQWTDLFESL